MATTNQDTKPLTAADPVAGKLLGGLESIAGKVLPLLEEQIHETRQKLGPRNEAEIAGAVAGAVAGSLIGALTGPTNTHHEEYLRAIQRIHDNNAKARLRHDERVGQGDADQDEPPALRKIREMVDPELAARKAQLERILGMRDGAQEKTPNQTKEKTEYRRRM